MCLNIWYVMPISTICQCCFHHPCFLWPNIILNVDGLMFYVFLCPHDVDGLMFYVLHDMCLPDWQTILWTKKSEVCCNAEIFVTRYTHKKHSFIVKIFTIWFENICKSQFWICFFAIKLSVLCVLHWTGITPTPWICTTKCISTSHHFSSFAEWPLNLQQR